MRKGIIYLSAGWIIGLATPSVVDLIIGAKNSELNSELERGVLSSDRELTLTKQKESGDLREAQIGAAKKKELSENGHAHSSQLSLVASDSTVQDDCDFDAVPLEKIELVYRAKTEQVKDMVKQALKSNTRKAMDKFLSTDEDGKYKWEVDVIALTLRENFETLQREVEKEGAASQEAFANTEHYSNVLGSVINSEEVELKRIQCNDRYCVAQLSGDNPDWSKTIEQIRANKEMHSFINLHASAGNELPFFFSFGERYTRISRGLLRTSFW